MGGTSGGPVAAGARGSGSDKSSVGCMPKRSHGRFVSHKRRRSHGRMRSRRSSKTITMSHVLGGAGVGYGVLALPAADGSSNLSHPAGAPARFVNVLTNAKDVFVSKDAYWAPTRGAVVGGTAILVGGKLLGTLIRSPSFKVGRHRIRLWG